MANNNKTATPETVLVLGGIGNSNGEFAEEYFFNSFDRGERVFLGEKFDDIQRRWKSGAFKNFEDEYDISLYTNTVINQLIIKKYSL